MLSDKNLLRIYLVGSLLCWTIYSYLSFENSAQSIENFHAPIEIPYDNPFVINIFLSLFFLAVFQYYKLKTINLNRINFNDLIWQGFITGALMFIALLLTRQILIAGQEGMLNNDARYVDFINNVNIIFITVFAAKTFYVFKLMILYQKSNSLLTLWKVYEFFMFLTLLLNLFDIRLLDIVTLSVVGFLSFLGLILSLNMKWVAYLTFKQKWRNILLIFLLLAIAASFIEYMYRESNQFGKNSIGTNFLVNDLSQKAFIITVFIFILFYCLSSILVILFNFPTSSVFEQKLGEVFNFQRLSQSIQMTDKEDQIYDVLLETSMSTVLADAAWLEIVDNKGNYSAFINKGIEKYDIFELKKILKRNKYDLKTKTLYFNNIKKLKDADTIGALPFKSLLLVPLFFQTKYLGVLGLIKNLPDGFNKEIIDVVNSFVSQASVSIENSRLMVEAIEHERYKEEIKIAKSVQRSLLPHTLEIQENYLISGFSKAADDVGGDYYDTYKIGPNKTGIFIADVSGHGTSAAFNMAQLKGVFHSLIQLERSPDKILALANDALSRCLSKNTFITASLYIIDKSERKVSHVRAGHCPTLYYSAENKHLEYHETKGLGIGILRNDKYIDHLEIKEFDYNPGDVMFLYTDGIVEAKDIKGEEYGFELLKDKVAEHIDQDPSKLIDVIIESVYDFCDSRILGDDYTCLAIKFV